MHRLVALALFAPSLAFGAEIVWLEAASDADRLAVESMAHPSLPPLSLLDLRAAASRLTSEDDAALAALNAAVEDVRQYETRLDGEMVIMRDLERPIAGVTVLRDSADRDALYKALTYQGFAVDRFFMGGLDTAPEAAPFRTDLGGVIVERPWVDAIALEPDRDVSPYEIAEAPQRVAYGAVRTEVSRLLPSSLVPTNLPIDGLLFVDGRSAELGPTGAVRVPVGRHLAHVMVDGVIVQRWDVRSIAGGEQELEISLTEAVVAEWVEGLRAGGSDPVPEALLPHLAALGGEVWFAIPGNRGVDVVKVQAMSVERESITRVTDRPTGERALTLFGAVQGGWLSNGNFSLDSPNPQYTRGEVNAANLGLTLGASYSRGWFRAGVGLQTAYTPGVAHVAYYASEETPFRLYPYLAVGMAPIQLTVGYAFPHHPTLGLRSEIPLAAGLELQSTAWLGLATEKSYDSGEVYVSTALYALTIGVGYRFGVGG